MNTGKIHIRQCLTYNILRKYIKIMQKNGMDGRIQFKNCIISHPQLTLSKQILWDRFIIRNNKFLNVSIPKFYTMWIV